MQLVRRLVQWRVPALRFESDGLRAGRFDRQVLVDRPDKAGRIAILHVHLPKVRLAAGVDAVEIAALTAGFSGADLANLVNEAAMLATRRGADSVETLAQFVADNSPPSHKALQHKEFVDAKVDTMAVRINSMGLAVANAAIAHLRANPRTQALDGNRTYQDALASLMENQGAIIVIDAQSLLEVKRLPMSKPVGKYNVWNKTHLSEGTSH